MIRIDISPEDLAIINRERFYHPQPHIMIRMHVLALHAKGENATRIAELLGLNRKTAQSCLHSYEKHGLDGIYRYEKHVPTSELEGFSKLIEDELAKNPPKSLNEANANIEKLTGIKRSLTQVRKFLKKRNSMFENRQHPVQSRYCCAMRICTKHV